ncbi:MAG: tetratricopeptide repeat protein [Bacteroidetes bacterium]|nr:tetratricopeptide repeat protein [Bacteroidota bacterium]MBU2584925.1 tetratricopeptide repeat protein [Bacteroidota bacterium]
MKKIYLSILLLSFLGLTLTAYQCASTEITSARLYIQQKNIDKAEDVLKKEVEKNPQSEEGWFLTGYVRHEKRDYTGMMDAFERAKKLGNKFEAEISNMMKASWAENFNSAVLNLNAANKMQDQDSAKTLRQQAINDFKMAIKLQPDSSDTYKSLALAYLSGGDMEGALEPSQMWIKKTKALEGYQIVGEILYTKAEATFNKYYNTKNESDSVLAMNQYQKSIQILEEGLKVHPGDGTLTTILFNAYISTGKRDFALKKAEEAVQKRPDDKFANYNYATMLLEMKDYPNAAKYFEKALEVDPNYENAIYNLAATYINWGVAVREKEEQDQVTERTFKKYFQSALKYLEKMAELHPDDYKIWERLGQVYANLGQSEKAQKAFEKADSLKK